MPSRINASWLIVEYCDDPLQISRDHRAARRNERADGGNHRNNRCKDWIDGERNHEQPRVGIDPNLYENRRMQQRGDGGRRNARVRQPAVQREGRGFRENPKQNQNDAPRGNLRALHGGELEGARLRPDAEKANQHNQRAKNGNNKRLVCTGNRQIVPIEPNEPPSSRLR